ncbi:MAG: AAA family ATPase, partial [Solirubrobacteraceae bacterium]
MSVAAGVAPPHNIAAECGVLGAVLLSDVVLPALLLDEGLKPEHFYRDTHRVIWSAMSAMSDAGQHVDVLTLAAHLDDAGTLQAAGGQAAIDGLTGGVPGLGGIRRYAQIVIEDWRWRQRVDAAHEQLAATNDRDEAAHQRAVTTANVELAAAAGPNVFELLSVADLANLKPPEFLIDTLLPAGGFSVLFGPSGVGKSFLALDWALCIANGIAWYGQTVQPGWVLYICAEGRSGLGIRVHAWQQARRQREVERIRFLPDAVNFLDAAQLAKARLTMAALPEPPALIVIDTMARSMVGGD